MSNIQIVAHGDLDGITSAALLAEQLKIESEDLNVVFTQPFLVDKVVIPDKVDQVYVVDIAINNRDPEMTADFVRRLGGKLVRWYDHHEGWPPYTNPIRGMPDPIGSAMYERRQFHTELDLCCALAITNKFSDTRVMDAIVADTREGELSPTGQLIDRAIKADMSNNQIREWAVKLLMGDEDYRNPLKGMERAYQMVENETYRLSRGFMIDGNICYNPADNEKVGIVAFVDATGSNHEYDLTQLLLAGQKLATFAVVKTANPVTSEKMVTVATKSKTNLVELFGLPSGASFRVTLPATRLVEAIEKLQKE